MGNKVSINQCSICLNEFHQPKLIDCHHRFCLGCLEDYVSRFARNGWFPCPLCRRNNKVPTGGVKDFSSNFYIDQTESVNKVYCVNHDEQKPVELYCKQCFQAVCLKCYITNHNGHEVLDLENEIIKDYVKIDQTEVSKQLDEKIKTYDDHLEKLKLKTFRLDLITKTSKDKIDRKVMELCEELKKRGEDFIADIQDVDDRESRELFEATDVVEDKQKDPRNYVKLLEDSSGLQSLVKVLDTLPKAKALLADNCSTDINFPEVGFPIFNTNDRGLNITGEQLGELNASKMIMFRSSFCSESLKDGKHHNAVDKYDLGQLSVYLMATMEEDRLKIFLYINGNDNSKNLMFCIVEFTIKLVSFTDSSKSILKETKHTYQHCTNGCGWSFIEWNKLIDPLNGFIDDNKNFHVEASAICTDIKWKE